MTVYATPVVVGGRLVDDAWCGMKSLTSQSWRVLYKPHISIIPDPFLVKTVWLRETTVTVIYLDLQARSKVRSKQSNTWARKTQDILSTNVGIL